MLAVRIGFFLLTTLYLWAAPTLVEEPPQLRSSALHRLQVETLVSGLNHPWGLAWWRDAAGSAYPLISERNGGLWLLTKRGLAPLVGLPDDVSAYGQGGWLDLAIDADNQVFLSYARQHGTGQATSLARFIIREDGGAYRVERWQVIFTARPVRASSIHFGAPLALVGDAIYLGLGERGQRQEAQSLASHLGSLVKLTFDGQAVADAPFAAQSGALAEIWSYGHRNPQGLAWVDGSQTLFASEHGPRGGDELNRIRGGANYGWPVISYGREYRGNAPIGEGTAKEGMEQPLQQWTPSPALSALAYYSSAAASSNMDRWADNLLLASLVDQSLYRLPLNRELTDLAPGQERLVFTHRLRQVKVDDEGRIYLLTDERDGRLLRISAAD